VRLGSVDALLQLSEGEVGVVAGLLEDLERKGVGFAESADVDRGRVDVQEGELGGEFSREFKGEFRRWLRAFGEIGGEQDMVNRSHGCLLTFGVCDRDVMHMASQSDEL